MWLRFYATERFSAILSVESNPVAHSDVTLYSFDFYMVWFHARTFRHFQEIYAADCLDNCHQEQKPNWHKACWNKVVFVVFMRLELSWCVVTRFITFLFLQDWNCHLFVALFYSIEHRNIHFKTRRKLLLSVLMSRVKSISLFHFHIS